MLTQTSGLQSSQVRQRPSITWSLIKLPYCGKEKSLRSPSTHLTPNYQENAILSIKKSRSGGNGPLLDTSWVF